MKCPHMAAEDSIQALIFKVFNKWDVDEQGLFIASPFMPSVSIHIVNKLTEVEMQS